MLKSCNLHFQAFYIQNSTVYRYLYWKINFPKSRDSQTFGTTCLLLVELEHKYFAPCFFYVLTSHSAQKFYLLIHVGHWLLFWIWIVHYKLTLDHTCICADLCCQQNILLGFVSAFKRNKARAKNWKKGSKLHMLYCKLHGAAHVAVGYSTWSIFTY